VPTQNNGRSIYKPIETAYLHADSNDYGWGAILNDDSNYQARGFMSATDRLHHITWKELRAVRHAIESFLTQLKRPARPPPRGQHVSSHRANQAYLPVTRYVDRAASLVVPTRHQRHPHPPPLHPFGREHLGIYTQPRTGHKRLAAKPSPARPPPSPVGTPHYRPARLYAQHSAPTVQHHMARPTVRGCRLPTPTRRSLEVREQLLQPSMDIPTCCRRQTKPITRYGYRRGPLLAQQDVVPRPAATRHRNLTLPGVTRPFVSRQARQARGVGPPAWSIVALRLTPSRGSTPDAVP
jgi:hypothetical protein